jgi:hypothetical protein
LTFSGPVGFRLTTFTALSAKRHHTCAVMHMRGEQISSKLNREDRISLPGCSLTLAP